MLFVENKNFADSFYAVERRSRFFFLSFLFRLFRFFLPLLLDFIVFSDDSLYAFCCILFARQRFHREYFVRWKRFFSHLVSLLECLCVCVNVQCSLLTCSSLFDWMWSFQTECMFECVHVLYSQQNSGLDSLNVVLLIVILMLIYECMANKLSKAVMLKS